MLLRNIDGDRHQSTMVWEDLINGNPTLVGLAHLCSQAMTRPEKDLPPLEQLNQEAQTLLFLGLESGAFSIRANRDSFEPADRFLAVCIEKNEGKRMEFRCPGNLEQTIRFMDGFRDLCEYGLVMHQVLNEFSFAARGYDFARQVNRESVEEKFQWGREVE